MTKVYGIIGYPLSHTLSPVLHNWGFEQHGLDARYDAWPTLPDELDSFVSRVRLTPIYGVSVTIPHKETVMARVDRVTDRARAVGAVNTLYWDAGELVGENTDVIGCLEPLKELPRKPCSGLVLGAGGAARAAVAALKELGVKEVAVTGRTFSKANVLAVDLGVSVIDWDDRLHHKADLIINATPLGMSGKLEEYSPWPLGVFPPRTVVFDLVYNPAHTRLVRDAYACGCTVIPGLSMFLHQGLKQFELWTEKRLNPVGAEALLKKALGQA